MESQMQRIAWIDATKGLAISLVVFGHVLGGAMARGWINPSGTPRFIYDYIYSFHMPLFFLISGALAIEGIRSNPSRAILSRMGSIVWPYMFWGLVFIILEPFIAHFMPNHPQSSGLSDAFKRLILGETSWFLWALFFGHCVLVVTSKMPVRLVFALSILVYLLFLHKYFGAVSMLINYMPFMVFGAIIGRRILSVNPSPGMTSVIIGIFLFGILFTLVVYRADKVPMLSLLCGIVGSAGSIMIAQSFNSTRFNFVLANVGAASLVVFLLHPYFQGAAREITLRTLGESPWWQLMVPTIVGITGPTLVWILTERLSLHWLFRLDFKRLSGRANGAKTISPR
jgi:fucose 4-O-acetylase-like acetyltransferase